MPRVTPTAALSACLAHGVIGDPGTDLAMHSSQRTTRGVSLVEALVALAVMAFGMLGVVGIQSTLRTNADLSRQRAEAVRLAQAEVERLRNYSVLLSADAGTDQLAFEDIASVGPTDIAASNATFALETVIAPVEIDDPLVRHVRVNVSWSDRTGQSQAVELRTLVAGVPLELGALPSMRSDRGPLQQPRGRNASIPRGAVIDSGGTTSSFAPPGTPDGTVWVFDNATGLILSQCTAPSVCTTPTYPWQLLSGTIAFATGADPTPAEAEVPSDVAGSAVALSLRVRYGTASFSFVDCVTEPVPSASPTRLNYFCAVPTNAATQWTGHVVFGGVPLATDTIDATSTNLRVCRYTPDSRNHSGSPPTTPTLPAGENAAGYNARHPWRYIRVSSPLVDKNFLLISAGAAGTAYSCPAEDTGTLIQSNTFFHPPP
jgi:Tfp pilus assembly protein PilV